MRLCNMQSSDTIGRINSIQSLGTLDGPGIRFVVFMQGCNLRCGYCHNPDTWDIKAGTEVHLNELLDKAIRYKSYFGKDGGVTVSGGEPLLQAKFVNDFFKMCHKEGINTCLDTSGSIMNENVKELLRNTDRVLLDIKFTNDDDYIRYIGCNLESPLLFLDYVNKNNIPTTIRQVIVPTLNDNKDSILKLKEIISDNKCVDKVELLPFKKICKVKYDNLGTEFPFETFETPDKDLISSLNRILSE